MQVKIIQLDLDGTLLNSEKKISARNYRALERAAEQGVYIVPSTGRFYDGMPQVVRDLPFVKYAITVNGAQIYDVKNKAVLHRAEIPPERAMEICRYMDTLPGVYDCYVDGWGYMKAELYARIDAFISDPRTNKMVKDLRKPLEDFYGFLQGRSVQKAQIFFADMGRRALELERMAQRFPDMAVTSSIVNNIEINAADANKGEALRVLSRHLGVDIKDTMAFGDGSNDLTMIQTAGNGVAMENAYQGLKDAADYVTLSNDEDGVADAIERFVLNES